jgi:phosphatidylglycerophosphate synthase
LHSQSRPLLPDLLGWSEGHAATMITVAALVAIAGPPIWLLSAIGALSFLHLSYRCRNRWTPGGRFGPANAVTLARLCGVFALPFLPPVQVAWAGAILLALDGVDGWIARRNGLSGEFGALFDMESDAFFMLLLCLMLYGLPDGFGAWILLPGLLRYLFVLFVRFARPPVRKEPRTAAAGWIFVLMMSALLLGFAAYPGYLDHARPLAAVMSLVLAFSFAQSLYSMYRGPRRSGSG